MKSMIMLLSLLGMAGCGAVESQNSQTNEYRYGTVGVVYSFAVDRRPVDGSYVNLTLFSPNGSEFDIVHSTISGWGSKQQKTVAERIPCQVNKAGQVIHSIKCKKDQRPVDGILNIITIIPSRYGKGQSYDAFQHVKFWDRINHKPITKTTQLGSNLQLVNR